MPTTLSLRRLSVVYKQVAIEQGGHGKADLVLLQDAVYGGARGVLMVLNHLAESDDSDEVHRTIQRFGKQIRALTGIQAITTLRESTRPRLILDPQNGSGADDHKGAYKTERHPHSERAATHHCSFRKSSGRGFPFR